MAQSWRNIVCCATYILMFAVGDVRADFYPAHGSQDHVYFWRQDSQEHFWFSAAGTFFAAQIFQYYGMSRAPAITISALEIAGVGVAKAVFIDPKPGKNALTCDALGILLGTLLNVTIRFDYNGSKSAVREIRATGYDLTP